MKHPEEDIESRTPIWDCLQNLYMDTDVSLLYDYIASVCAESRYSLAELESILFNEVLPALRFNMFDLPAPEWCGFETSWVVDRVLQKHVFGKRRPWFLRWYTHRHWLKVKSLIEAKRKNIA